MNSYTLPYEGDKVRDLLDKVDTKTLYGRATAEEAGLMSPLDAAKLDEIGTMSNLDIERIINT